MISFEEYYTYLQKRKKLSFHYNQQFEQLANNSKYLRSNRIIKRYQKDLEKERASSFNVLNNIFKEEQKKKGVIAVIKVDQQKESKLKLFFRKIFGIKPPVISGVIEEFSETSKAEIPEGWKERTDIVVSDDIGIDYDDEFDDEDFEDEWDEEAEDFFDDDRIEGQMDIEELNEGDVYEEK